MLVLSFVAVIAAPSAALQDRRWLSPTSSAMACSEAIHPPLGMSTPRSPEGPSHGIRQLGEVSGAMVAFASPTICHRSGNPKSFIRLFPAFTASEAEQPYTKNRAI